jgi:glycine cleavage system transcriptional repressor
LEYGAGVLKNYFLLTAFGKDRPGMVAGVSQTLVELQGNIEDASMSRLGGEFAMMLVTALPKAVSVAALEKRFKAFEKKLGLQIAVKGIPASAAHRSSKEEPPKYLISVYGTDRPGIVHQITHALAKRHVGITDLQTKVIGGAKKPVYVMLLELQVPPALDMDALRTELDLLRQDLGVEISFQDIEAIAL